LAIKENQHLDYYDNNHDFDNMHMLNQDDAKKLFSMRALANLEELVNACK
jgi:hypothetical protein